LRLVINIAKRYTNLGVPLMDLIEEGNLGLMKSVERYNPKLGYRFSTYAAWWVRQRILRAISDQGKMIRLPVYMSEMVRKYKKMREELSHKHRGSPSYAEIAKKMRLPLEKLIEIAQCAGDTYSLERPIGEEGEGEFIDIIEDGSAASPTDEVSKMLRHERVVRLLEKLNAREQKLLSLRYGLTDDSPKTLEEVAKKFHLTRERIRQLEKHAFEKMRALVDQKGGSQ